MGVRLYMSPYKKLRNTTLIHRNEDNSENRITEVTSVMPYRACIQPSGGRTEIEVEVSPEESDNDNERSIPRTRKLNVEPAGIHDYLTPKTVKRAKNSKWAKVLPPYKIRPETTSSSSSTSDDQLQNKPAKFNFQNQVKNMANVIGAGTRFQRGIREPDKPYRSTTPTMTTPPNSQSLNPVQKIHSATKHRSHIPLIRLPTWNFLEFKLHWPSVIYTILFILGSIALFLWLFAKTK